MQPKQSGHLEGLWQSSASETDETKRITNKRPRAGVRHRLVLAASCQDHPVLELCQIDIHDQVLFRS